MNKYHNWKWSQASSLSLSTSLCFSFPLTAQISWFSIHFQNLIFMRFTISALLLFFLIEVFFCIRKPFQTTVYFNISSSWWKTYFKLWKSAPLKSISPWLFFFLKQVNIYILKHCHLIRAAPICHHSFLPSLVYLLFQTYYCPRMATACCPTSPLSVASPQHYCFFLKLFSHFRQGKTLKRHWILEILASSSPPPPEAIWSI